MIEVQLLLGCRPGELVRFTPNMIQRSRDVWEIKLSEHKTSYKDRERIIFVGPKAQEILKRYLLRGGDVPLFSPKEAMNQHRASKHAHRKTPLSCGNRPGSNVKAKPKKGAGLAYTTQSYSKAISRAAKRGGVAHWSANQLRHTRATEIRSQFGLEATAAILGHAEVGVTQVYAEADIRRAIEVARLTG
jgi:integrase